jgi:hypothetical protein
MLKVAKWVNTDLLNDFTVFQVAKKLDWPESLVWSQSMVNANDFDRFKALIWCLSGKRDWEQIVWYNTNA